MHAARMLTNYRLCTLCSGQPTGMRLDAVRTTKTGEPAGQHAPMPRYDHHLAGRHTSRKGTLPKEARPDPFKVPKTHADDLKNREFLVSHTA